MATETELTALWDSLPEQTRRLVHILTRDPARDRPFTTTEIQQTASQLGWRTTRDTIARWLRLATYQARGGYIARAGKTSAGEHQWKPTAAAWTLIGAVFGAKVATPGSDGRYRCIAEMQRPAGFLGDRVEVWHAVPDGHEPTGDFGRILCGIDTDTGINAPGSIYARYPTCPTCLAIIDTPGNPT